MNRIIKDIMSILESVSSIVLSEIKGISTSLYRVFKNDNKSHVNKSKLNHGINPMQDPNGLSRLTTGSYTKAGCSTPGNVKNSSYDSNQNENNTNVHDEDGVDENDWRDRFTGWLP